MLTPMSARLHALLFRQLTTKCGGLLECCEALEVQGVRLSDTQLSRYQNENETPPAFASIRVVEILEAYCGEAVYTQHIAGRQTHQPMARTITEAASEATEDAAELQYHARHLKGGKLTPADKRALNLDIFKVEAHLNDLRALLAADGATAPGGEA